jgi:hypothetical protein
MKGVDMKTIYSVMLLPFLVILLFVTHVSGSEWDEYGRSSQGDILSYNGGSIKQMAKDIVQVKTKVDFSDEGREAYFEFWRSQGISTNKIDKLSYISDLQEIDCNKKLFRTLSTTFYDNKGNVLEIAEPDVNIVWGTIIQDTVIDTLQKLVCK